PAARPHQGSRCRIVRSQHRQSREPVAPQDRARPEEPPIHQDGLGRRLPLRSRSRFRMSIGSIRLWPRTLAAQLVLVTGAAVLLSNFAVALWFGLGQQQLTESAIVDRVLDRAVSASNLLATIPAKQRAAAAHALSSNIWIFLIHHGRVPAGTMTDD